MAQDYRVHEFHIPGNGVLRHEPDTASMDHAFARQTKNWVRSRDSKRDRRLPHKNENQHRDKAEEAGEEYAANAKVVSNRRRSSQRENERGGSGGVADTDCRARKNLRAIDAPRRRLTRPDSITDAVCLTAAMPFDRYMERHLTCGQRFSMQRINRERLPHDKRSHHMRRR
jgi:hypothetical protein